MSQEAARNLRDRLHHWIVACAAFVTAVPAFAETAIDVSGYRADCEVKVQGFDGHLIVTWPMAEDETGEVALDLSGTGPMIQSTLR